MAKLVFYTHVRHQTQFICRLVAGLWEKKKIPIIIIDSNIPQLQDLDEQLWQFDRNTFLAHQCVLSTDIKIVSPIVLTDNIQRLPEKYYCNTLINRNNEICTFSCDHIIEIAGIKEDELAQARHRFRLYRDHHFQITHHDMQGKA